jgi:6-phosphofructokinase 1
MVGVSAPFAPLALKGLIVNPQKPLEFQFIVDTGSDVSLRGAQATKQSQQEQLKQQTTQLVKYFLAGLTIPEGDLWVNLSPYEKDRMVPAALGQTDLGRDLLAQDYILKQLTASLIYPEKDLGKEFWSRVYAKAQQQFGATNVPVNTFNKVWILPDQAQVFENGNAAYVTKSTLKVMLDEDYLALSKHSDGETRGQGPNINRLGSQIVREIVIPEITKEINTGKNFAPLRQIYQALILAKWYKETIQNGLLDAVYTNKNKVAGVNLSDPAVKEQIYERYLKAYKKGAFNYIKEESFPPLDEEGKGGVPIARKYFSGGTSMEMTVRTDGAMSAVISDGAMMRMDVDLEKTKDTAMNAGDENITNKAMHVKRPDIKRIAVLTGGGLATGHNSLIAAAVREAKAQGPDVKILGIPNGWAGLIDPDLRNQIRRLTVKEMERVENQGGSIIKSSRTNPLKVSDDDVNKELIKLGRTDLNAVSAAIREEIKQALVAEKVKTLIGTLKKMGIDGLIVMGGDDTNGVSSIIHAYAPDFPILGVPKTMDNDVYLPEGVPTYGYDSFITAAANNLRYDMRSAIDQDRIFVVETFGRDAGFTAIGSGARVGATLTLIPEQGKINVDDLVKKVRAFYNKNKYALIVVSEGVKFGQTKNSGREADAFGNQKLEGAGEECTAILSARLKDIKVTVTNAAKLDYTTREAPISLADGRITQSLGRAAVKLLRNGVTGKILYTDGNYDVKEMSFPNIEGIVTYEDNKGHERTMNISQLRGDGPDVKAQDKRKIGGRVAHIEEGGIDRDAYVAANQAIFGEQSVMMRIKLALNRIGKEMAFDIAKMSQLLDLSEELKQLRFAIDDLNPAPDKHLLDQRASEIRNQLSELIKTKAANIASGQLDAAMSGQNPIISTEEEFNPYSTAESILSDLPNSGLTIEPKRIRLLGNALYLAHLFIDMHRDVPLEEINKMMRENNVTRPLFIQALRYFLSSSVERNKARAVSLIYTLYLYSKEESRTKDLNAGYKEASRVIDILNALAKDLGGIDLNQINVKRNGKTVNVQFDQAQLNALMQGGFEGFTPVIISITPIQSPFQLLGINSAK